MKKNANANRTGLILGLLLSLSIMTPLVGCGSKPSQSVSGQVTAGGSAFSSVTMTLSGPSVNTMTTDAGGNYFFNDVEEGTYTLTPAFTGYTFTPASRAVFIFGMNATASRRPTPFTPNATGRSGRGGKTTTVNSATERRQAAPPL
ncbi:MAG: hypothetical protein NTY86_02455 [Deltaproteobacteria bacterium]|nr:hypothetical protein [Deltaproteobacteria bacterium]